MVLSVSDVADLANLVGSRTAVIVPDFAQNIAVRGGWQWSRYALVDRGSYDYASDVDEPALAEHVVAEAARLTGRTLRVTDARALRLGPGDYVLARHDRVYEGFPIEVVIDLSPAPVARAEVHYRRRGQLFFRVPSQPGAASFVERGPTVTCNHTYVSRRFPDVSVVRLVLVLAAG
jgi:hypothetical protein